MTANKTTDQVLRDLRLACDLVQACADGAETPESVADRLGTTPNRIAAVLRGCHGKFLRTYILKIPELANLIARFEYPADRIIRDAFFPGEVRRADTDVILPPPYDEDVLWEILDEIMTPVELEIIESRTGARGHEKRSLDEIAEKAGLTSMSIQIKYARALRKLRAPYAANKLFPELTARILEDSKPLNEAIEKATEEFAELQAKYDALHELDLIGPAMERAVDEAENQLGKTAREIIRDARTGVRPKLPNDETLIRNLIARNALSARLGNALRRAEIDDLRELAAMPPEEIARIRTIGKKTITELARVIQEYTGVDRRDLIDYVNEKY